MKFRLTRFWNCNDDKRQPTAHCLLLVNFSMHAAYCQQNTLLPAIFLRIRVKTAQGWDGLSRDGPDLYTVIYSQFLVLIIYVSIFNIKRNAVINSNYSKHVTIYKCNANTHSRTCAMQSSSRYVINVSIQIIFY